MDASNYLKELLNYLADPLALEELEAVNARTRLWAEFKESRLAEVKRYGPDTVIVRAIDRCMTKLEEGGF